MAEIITKEEFKIELAKLFPSEILGFKRPVEPLPTNIEFDTDMLQWISKDPAFFASLNMFFSRCLSNDARLQEWVNQIFDALAKQDFNLATTKLKGLMSAADKTKLDGIQNGAEVNQNSFSVVKAGATNITATSESDTIEFVAGSNISLTPSGKKIEIKVNGIANGAEVNQNAFSSVQVGTTKVNATTKTDILNIAAGKNIEIVSDPTGKKITISSSEIFDDTGKLTFPSGNKLWIG